MDGKIRDCSFLILAGGKSRRMGRCKAQLPIAGTTFLEYLAAKGRAMGFQEVLVSGYSEPIPGTVNIPDVLEDRGPLGGMYACFQKAALPHCFVLSVDVPLISEITVKKLIKAHESHSPMATLLVHHQKTEPLIGVYDTGDTNRLFEVIREHSAPIFTYLDIIGYQTVELEEPEETIYNFNTPKEYGQLEKLLETFGGSGERHGQK